MIFVYFTRPGTSHIWALDLVLDRYFELSPIYVL